MRLAVFLDGTWADPADGTNVWQLYVRAPQTPEQLTFYEQGVGSRAGERLRGGILGWGIDRQIVAAYEFLATAYTPGDALFLIGFSRGATGARSLGGMITHNGLIHPSHMRPQDVYARYRERSRVPGLLEMRTGRRRPETAGDRVIATHSAGTRIHFTGVFDTVGALGVPGGLMRRLSRRRYEFHDRQLSGLNDRAYQALAVDEHRRDFQATMWAGVPRRVQFPDAVRGADEPSAGAVTVEQRWFAGAHGNVGGGGARPDETNPLSLITREWIADRARDAGLDIAPAVPGLLGREWRGRISDSHGGFMRGVYKWISPPVDRRVGAEASETAAPSLLQRWDGITGYRPRNPGLRRLLGR